jgi:capsular polysaccharide biosynthesis protein
VHGSNGFDVIELVDYIREKRLLFVISGGVAVLLALAASLVLPKQYTAKSTVLIDAPNGSDPRVATAMTPAYLESLKTYETLASSDTLFSRAAERLHVEGSKVSVLKVSRPGSTAVIEISATLRDPKKAQALAQDIADQAVELDGTIESKSADDPSEQRLKEAVQARATFEAVNPIEPLENEVQEGFEAELQLDQDLARARTDLTEKSAATEPSPVQSVSLQTRIRAMETQRRELAALLENNASQLDARKSRRKELEDAETAVRATYEIKRRTFNDAPFSQSSSTKSRGRLHVIDPGVVPQHASFPNIPLNVAAAFLASLAGTVVWLMLRFSYVRLQRERSERLYSLR